MEKSSFHPPAAAMSKKKKIEASSLQAEAQQEAAEVAADTAKIEAKKKSNEDKIAQLLGAQYFITDHAWPFLRSGAGALTVSRFYPEINVAIDTFSHVGDHELRLIEIKKKALNEHGIKYAWLDWTKQSADIVPELESQ